MSIGPASEPTTVRQLFDGLKVGFSDIEEYEVVDGWDNNPVGVHVDHIERVVTIFGRSREDENQSFKVEHEGCPRDTDGDGNCGLRFCPFCGVDSDRG